MVFESLTALFSRRSADLGHTPWRPVSKSDVETFAELTGDDQWIHLNEDMARRCSPFGQTIVHGALILALAPVFAGQLLRVGGARHMVNAGMDRVRFRQPVPVGASIRGVAKLTDVEDFSGGALARINLSIEIECVRRPACTCEQRVIVHA